MAILSSKIDQVVQTYSDGVLVEHTTRTINKKVRAEEFIRVYLEDISSVIKLKNGTDYKVLLALCKFVGYNSNEIILVKAMKIRIAELADVKLQTVSDSIVRLLKNQLLIKSDTSVYRLNPKYFFTGNEIMRDKMLKLSINYTIEKASKEDFENDSE